MCSARDRFVSGRLVQAAVVVTQKLEFLNRDPPWDAGTRWCAAARPFRELPGRFRIRHRARADRLADVLRSEKRPKL
jgi:hypothetical protein